MDEYKNACNYVAKLLAQYPRTVNEIEKKLYQKGYEEEIRKETIKYFIEHKLLSDKEYAQIFLENQIKYRPVGRILCRNKMIKKGLKIDLVDSVLADNFSEDIEVELAFKLAKSKEKEVADKNSKTKITKIGQYLSRKGFSEGLIWQVLEKLNLLD